MLLLHFDNEVEENILELELENRQTNINSILCHAPDTPQQRNRKNISVKSNVVNTAMVVNTEVIDQGMLIGL